MSEELIKNIKEIAEPIIAQENAFLVDVEVKHSKLMEVWILADSETGGISLDTCSKISRQVSFDLDEQGIVDSAYRLNVSSPGLSRPLSDWRQYQKNVGKTAKVKYKPGDKYVNVEGLVKNVQKQSFVVATENGQQIEINFSDVIETKIIPKI